MAAKRNSQPHALDEAMRASRGLIAWSFAFGAGVNLLYLAPSIYMLQVYDRVLQTGGLTTLGFISLALVFALMTLSFVDAMRARLMARLGARLERLVAPRLLALSTARAEPGKPRQALLREFDTLRQTFVGPGMSALLDAPWTPLFVLVCAVIHPLMGGLVAVGGVFLLLIAFLSERAQRKSIAETSEAAARLYTAQDANTQSGEVIRALGMGPALAQRQLAARADLNLRQSRAIFTNTTYSALTRFLRLLLQSAMLGLGAWLAIGHQISPGAMIAASILSARALAPLEQVVAAWRPLGLAANSYRLIAEALAAADDEAPRTSLPAPRGALKFERVSLRAPGTARAILNDINFDLNPGEILGIIGPSGAGKSTLARLAAGALSPEFGAVRLDGASLADWRAEALGRHVGYLPQEVSLLAGTVAENIARFSANVGESDAEIVAAAKQAGAHAMILRLANGYDTTLDQGGRGLSLGQAQRIALARALFREPPLLVLDEPNSHLDQEGEAALVEAIRGARARGAGIIVVAHRAGILAAVDRLLVLREGRLEAIGPRDEITRKLAAAAEGSVTPLRPKEIAP